MGWFWGSSNDDSNSQAGKSAKPSDPISSLDPSLQKYLKDHEQKAEQPPQPSPEPPPTPAQQLPPPPSDSTSEPDPNAPPPLPPQANPKYAHLWKTYQPPTQASFSAQGELHSVLDLARRRESLLNAAAQENCIEATEALQTCIANLKWFDAFGSSACMKEQRRAAECVRVQKKLLRVLGYFENLDGGKGESERLERIQMHADRIYREGGREDGGLEGFDEGGEKVAEKEEIK